MQRREKCGAVLKFSKQEKVSVLNSFFQILVYYIINCFTLVFNGFEL